MCQDAPYISHLLFADDNMLYAQATPQDCLLIQHILQIYEKPSGVLDNRVNLQKSSVVFSKSVPSQQQLDLASLLGVTREEKQEKYLGLPTCHTLTRE